jgi:hypothetical protein
LGADTRTRRLLGQRESRGPVIGSCGARSQTVCRHPAVCLSIESWRPPLVSGRSAGLPDCKCSCSRQAWLPFYDRVNICTAYLAPIVIAGTLADTLADQDIELRPSTSASVSSPASSETAHSTTDADNNNGKECKSKAPPNGSLARLIWCISGFGHKGGLPKNEKHLLWAGLRGVTVDEPGEAAPVLVDIVGSWHL